MTKPEGGFSIIPNWVIRESDLTGHEILVYIALLNRANSSGLAWPSVARIAAESRTSVSTVKRTLQSLQERGLVSKQIRPRGNGSNDSNIYRVATFQRSAPASAKPRFVDENTSTPVHTEPHPRPEGTNPPSTLTYEEDPIEEDPTEEDMRFALAHERAFSFVDYDGTATTAQLAYLNDLHIHYNGDKPSDALATRWGELSTDQATELITQYLAQMPRHDEYQGPEIGEPAFDALSDAGKEWAETGMVPV